MIPTEESLTVEFKRAVKVLDENIIIEAVVALSNTQGGSIYLGVENDGRVTGLNKKQADEVGAAALIANMTVPSVSVSAEILEVEGLQVLRINVPRADWIVSTSSGKMLRRRIRLDGTPENTPMFAFEINSRLSDLRVLDYSEQVVRGAHYGDLDPNERLRLRKIIQLQRGDQNLLDLSDEELDMALRLVKSEEGELRPTITGLLLMGKEESIDKFIPTARASFQVLEGTQIRMNEEFAKPLLATFELFSSYFQAWNPERELELGLFRMPIPEFSDAAFREGLVNAFCHRDYTILKRVRVLVDDNGLTISSPGGFIDGVYLENLLSVEPMGRNRCLADALKRIGLAEKTGRGIDRIFEGSIVFGRPWPDYTDSTASNIKLYIPRSKADLAFTKMISQEENRTGKSLSIHSLMVLSILQNERNVDIKRLASLSQVGEYRIKTTLAQLIENGLVEAFGSGAARSYMLSSKVYRDNNDSIAYVHQTGIDSLRSEELCLKLARQQGGYLTRRDVVTLLHLSDAQAYRLLKKLVEKGYLLSEGNGRATKYRLVESHG